MGTGGGPLQLFTLLSSPPPPPHPLHNLYPHKFSKRNHSPTSQTNHTRWFSFSSSKAGGRVGGSEWERTRTGTHTPHGRSRYRDEFDYDEDEFGFGNTRKQRTWWSDDSSQRDTGIDDDDDELLDGLGVLEGSIGFPSIFKVLRSFGWMVPAIIISMMLGTGTNTFVMALALPLAQSALSLVFDMLWGWPTNNRRPKSKSQKRKRTSAGATSSSTTKEEKEYSSQNGKTVDGYQSWSATKNVSTKEGEKRTQNFGGWDELDRERRMQEEPNTARANQRRRETEGKLSRRVKNRQTPLLVRLLIAFFPFLGFWTKIL